MSELFFLIINKQQTDVSVLIIFVHDVMHLVLCFMLYEHRINKLTIIIIGICNFIYKTKTRMKQTIEHNLCGFGKLYLHKNFLKLISLTIRL